MVITLLSLIVLALMSVFNSTQAAFRSGVTQTGVLETSRAAMVLMTSDLKTMTPSGNYGAYNDVPNFYVISNLYYMQPLMQSLPGSSQTRTNVLQDFFVLSRANVKGHDYWVGVGYAVSATSVLGQPICPLYRFITNSTAETDPEALFGQYSNSIVFNSFTNAGPGWSHLLDGVVDLRVRAYDLNGTWLTNGFGPGQASTAQNAVFYPTTLGESGFCLFSNTLPATVELQMGVLEDHTLSHAESLGPGSLLQSNYLAQQAGRVHVFRQRIAISNLDPSAYQ